MKSSLLFLFVFSCFCLNGEFLCAQKNRVTPLENFLQISDLKHAAISFEVKDISNGQIISFHNKDMALTPASVNKIVTTATALEILGANYKFQTPIYYDGYIKNSILEGNLFIEGAGDPTLGSEFINQDKELFLNQCLKIINDAGIKQITGNLIIMDQLFGYEGVSSKWLWEDMGSYYAPGIYGISVFDNMYRVYIQSFNPGNLVKISHIDPPMHMMNFKNDLLSGTTNADNSFISGIPFSNERTIYGSVPPNQSVFSVKGDIPDPGLYLATYVKSYLEKNNVTIQGKASTYRLDPVDPKQRKNIGYIISPELSSIVRVINVRSNNHYAEHLYKLLTIRDSLDISEVLGKKGLDSSALFLFDGSGVSPQNAVSAGFINAILEYMYKKEGTEGAFYQSLPIAGKEGTVVSFLKTSVLEGKARVKSGSMTNVCSYAGYIDFKGKKYVFTIIINNFKGNRSQLRKEIGKLLVGYF